MIYNWLQSLMNLLPIGLISPVMAAGPVFNISYQPPVILQSKTADGATSITVNSTEAGNLLVVVILLNGSGTVSTVKDSFNNSFSPAVNGNDAAIWYLPSSAAGATSATVTFSVAPPSQQLYFLEVRGIMPGSAALDQAAGQNCPTGTAISAPTVTTTRSHDLVVSAIMAATATSSVNAPFTGMTIINGNMAAYYLPTAKGTYGAVFNQSPSGTSCASTAAFKGLW